MRSPRPGVGSELLPVALILVGLAATLGLVISMHRQAIPPRSKVLAPPPVAVVPPPPSEPIPTPPPPVVVVPPPPPPAPPPEDPTPKLVAQLSSQETEQRHAAEAADRKTAALDVARKAALAESQRLRRREAVIRAQVDNLAANAQLLEMDADALANERDVLLQERDTAKATLARALSKKGGFAVMPHRGANGTWQRPVVVECRDGRAILQPQGLGFSMLDMSGILQPRMSPLVMAVGRELVRIHRSTSPDGSSVIPYIYFVVRPDGVRPYYEARSRLEPLGIAFGYELVEQDWNIEFPDFDDLASWDGSPTLRAKDPVGLAGNANSGHPEGNSSATGTGNGTSSNGFVWPTERTASNRNGSPSGGGDNPLLWPTRPPGAPAGSGSYVDGDLAGDGPAGGRSGSGGSGSSNRGSSGTLTPLFGTGPGSTLNGLAGGDAEANSRSWLDKGPGGGPSVASLHGPGASTLGSGSSTNGAGIGLTGRPSGSSRGPAGPFNGSSSPGQGTAAGGRGAQVASTNRGGPVGGNAPDGSAGTGLVPLPAGGLPGLDSTDGSNPGATGTGLQASAGSATPLTGRASPGRMVASPTNSGGTNGLVPDPGSGAAGSGQPLPTGVRTPDSIVSTTPPGWIRIDPEQLARSVQEEEEPDPDRPPALPRATLAGARNGAGGSTSSNGSSSSDGSQSSSSSGGQEGSSTSSQANSQNKGLASMGDGDTRGDYRPKPVRPRPWSPKMTQTIDLPLELVVACGPEGVVIHPGGYRLSRAAMVKDDALMRDLFTIVRNHELIDPSVKPQPRLQFLVEPGGTDTYWEARRRTVLAGGTWPVSIQVAGGQAPDGVFPKERF